MANALAVGTLVNGRYRLVAPLGAGTFGDVWRAEDVNLGREVAIKLLRADFLDDAITVARFDGEAEALARLTHPNVVAVFDRGTWSGQRYLVTELCAGAPLEDWIASHKRAGKAPELASVREIFDQICAAVEAAHDVAEPGPMVHRDLKPGNVMLAAGKKGGHLAKVLDFGIARLADRHLTADGSPMGTPLYMPPEQATGSHGEVGPWSDVFSLGVILVEMLTLQQTAPKGQLWWLAVQLGIDVRATLRGLRADVPDAVWRVAERALAAEPSARFPDAGALREALTAAWDGTAPPRAKRKRALPPIAVVAGVALLAGVAMALAFTRVAGKRRRDAGAVAALGKPCPAGMVRIAGGTFQMGSPAGEGYDDERPRHPETVASFCLDRTEVTVAAYRACVESGACTEADREARCNWGVAGRDDHPINCIDWAQARAYCASAGKRLPSEKEWELAARGAEGRTYPWGDAPPADRACWNGEGSDVGKGLRESTCAVGSHPAGSTPEGVQDMAGNVWEWVEDVYCPYLAPGCAETARVNRGGAFSYGYATDLRAANRHRYAATRRSPGVGMRCARSD
jgi:formylglycine-generating enzyme required for sulfatase activity/tRNA A-37 threonylcarbamoyl transferase component Bud32